MCIHTPITMTFFEPDTSTFKCICKISHKHLSQIFIYRVYYIYYSIYTIYSIPYIIHTPHTHTNIRGYYICVCLCVCVYTQTYIIHICIQSILALIELRNPEYFGQRCINQILIKVSVVLTVFLFSANKRTEKAAVNDSEPLTYGME